MLELLGRPTSINVRKVLWLLAELKLPFTHTEWGSGALSLQAPEFLALNPNGLVPVLRDGELTLSESNTICRYLAAQLRRSGSGYVLPQGFTLADVGLGLSTHRWLATPMERPALPELAAYYERLCQRPGFAAHGRDAGP